MTRLRKFLALPWRDRLLVLRAFCVLAAVRAALLTMSFGRVRAAVRRTARERAASDWPAPEQVAAAVVKASSLMPGGGNCLVRALATEILLSRLGYRSELKIGTGKTSNGEIEAHAWLESEGRVVVGEFELGRYTKMNNTFESRI